MRIKDLTDDQRGNIFRRLATKTLYDVGMEFGLDKSYSTVRSMKASVYKVYNEVRMDPERFALQPDTVDLVTSAVSDRSVSNERRTIAEKDSEIAEMSIKDVMVVNRDMAAKLVKRKLDYLEAHPKALNQVSLPQLATGFAILFDKSQIIQGQATEHVALMGKIDSELSPEKAIDLVLKMREINQVEKHDK